MRRQGLAHFRSGAFCTMHHSAPTQGGASNACASFAAFVSGGKSDSSGTLRVRAGITSSASDTQRDCPSIFAMVSRSMSHPIRWQRAANAGCDQPRSFRRRRI